MTTKAVRIFRGRVVQRWSEEPETYRELIRGMATGTERAIRPDMIGSSIFTDGTGTLTMVGEVIDPDRVVRGESSASILEGHCTLTYASRTKSLAQVRTEHKARIDQARNARVEDAKRAALEALVAGIVTAEDNAASTRKDAVDAAGSIDDVLAVDA